MGCKVLKRHRASNGRAAEGIVSIQEIEAQVYEGIRKTISRFRRRPYEFFTEAELHTSLRQDIVAGKSELMTWRDGAMAVSLVHQEYPTNFRYVKEQLVLGYPDSPPPATTIDSKQGDRGNYDLVVLSPDFVDDFLSSKRPPDLSFQDGLEHVINKRVGLAIARKEAAEAARQADPNSHARESVFAIEVKYIHLFNARDSQMLREVVADCEKLRLAHHYSEKYVKAVNLVFCSSESRDRRDHADSVIDKVRELADCGKVKGYKKDEHGKRRVYRVPKGVALVFVESYLDSPTDGKSKATPKPTVHPKSAGGWMAELREAILVPKKKREDEQS